MVGDGTQLRTGEAAAILNVSDSTVIAWCRDNSLRTVRTAGGHRRIWADSVQDLAQVLKIADDAERRNALAALRDRNQRAATADE